MKKIRMCCILPILLLFLTGCWDQREINMISLAIGMAIDVGEKAQYKLTVEAINAVELNGKTASGNAPTVIFSVEGNTIAEVSQKLNIGYSRRILYSHMKAVVISKEIGEEGMLEFLDFLERTREIRDDFNFIVAKEGKAADILEVLYAIQKSSSLKLKAQLETAAAVWGLDPNIRLSDFLRALASPGRQPVLAAVRIEGDKDKGKSMDNLKSSKLDAMVVIDSLAIFQGKKLKGFLSIEDTRNYLWLDNKLDKTFVSVPCGEDGKYFAFRVTDSRTRLKGEIKNGIPNIYVDINMEGYVSTDQCNEPLNTHKAIIELEQKGEQFLLDTLRKTIHKTQDEYDVDIFGFGEVIEREDYKEFKKIREHWLDIYKEAKVDVKVTVNLSRTGLNTKGSIRDIRE